MTNSNFASFPLIVNVNCSRILQDIDEMLQKELEKIDQESRVARRAFENRISKHITIQVRHKQTPSIFLV